jgi:hypothetical protein
MTATPLAGRLFEPFLDPIDGVICVSANDTVRAIDERVADSRLRFPLFLDRDAPISEQLVASPYAVVSSRFGPFCDNVLGMNWRLPNGMTIRLGERVVKSTTGYDVFRFLLHAPRLHGEPTCFVLRLRPRCDETQTWTLSGTTADLDRAASEVATSCWQSWIDSVDLVFQGDGQQLRLGMHGPVNDLVILGSYVEQLASRYSLRLESRVDELPADGLPDLVFKTMPDRANVFAMEMSRLQPARCVVLRPIGVIHVYLDGVERPQPMVRELVDRFGDEIERDGGDWSSRWLDRANSSVEAGWLSIFRREAGIE